MQDIIPTLATTAFLVFCYDQKVIASLQRQGRYDPDTHQTVLSRLFFSPVKLLLSPLLLRLNPNSEESTTWKPEGDLSLFQYDTTVCLDSKGMKTRLSYFFDDNQHAWYMIENINNKGVTVKPPRFEPATVSFDAKKLQYVL